jgi:hypothetical protein
MRFGLLFGADGFDPDVVVNATRAYRKLGFMLVPSNEIREDFALIVVIRPPNRAIEFPVNSVVHIWDYVGSEISLFLGSLPKRDNVHIFVSSMHRFNALATQLVGQIINSRVMLLPVAVSIWSKSPKKLKHEVVHIGNLKGPLRSMGDQESQIFLERVREMKADVWGLGWDDLRFGIRYHGKAKLSTVSRIYSRSSLALGIMYPFQRNITISGRFWHAPLNGCALLTESLPELAMPGVISELSKNPTDLKSRKLLREEARAFWLSHESDVLNHLEGTLLSPLPEKRPNLFALLRLIARHWSQQIKWGILF